MAFERGEQRLKRLTLILHMFEQTFDLSGDGGLRVPPVISFLSRSICSPVLCHPNDG